MILAVIPAKAESSRLPNKNLLRINGKSLVEHAVEYARASEKIDEIVHGGLPSLFWAQVSLA